MGSSNSPLEWRKASSSFWFIYPLVPSKKLLLNLSRYTKVSIGTLPNWFYCHTSARLAPVSPLSPLVLSGSSTLPVSTIANSPITSFYYKSLISLVSSLGTCGTLNTLRIYRTSWSWTAVSNTTTFVVIVKGIYLYFKK